MNTNTQIYNDMWQQCLAHLRTQTTEEEFVKWFQPIEPLEFDGQTLRLRVPNASYVYQIEKNYLKFLRPIISQLYGQQTKLFYAVPKPQPQPQPEASPSLMLRRSLFTFLTIAIRAISIMTLTVSHCIRSFVSIISSPWF